MEGVDGYQCECTNKPMSGCRFEDYTFLVLDRCESKLNNTRSETAHGYLARMVCALLTIRMCATRINTGLP